MRSSPLAAILCALFFACATPALAATDLGLNLGPLIGTHSDTQGSTRVTPVPIPILEFRQRSGNLELFIEGLPLGPEIGENGSQQSSTALTFFDGTLRAYLAGNRIYAGVGELVYNQTTTSNGPFHEVDRSRVVGGRYEIGAALTRDRRLRLQLDLMPHVSGNVEGKLINGFSATAVEIGSQFETQLTYEVPGKYTSLRYGVRYINYATQFTFNHSLADRNVGFLPSVAFVWHAIR